MIFVILIAFTILFFWSWNSTKYHSKVMEIISTLLMLCTVGVIIATYNNHFGMNTENKVTTQRIKSVKPKMNLLLYSPLGSTKKHDIVMYKLSNCKKMHHSRLDINNKINIKSTNHNNAYLKTNKKYWTYKGFNKVMFKWANPKEIKSTKETFYIPNNWIKLSVKQAKSIKKLALRDSKQIKVQLANPEIKAQQAQKIQMIVQQKMQQIITKKPQIEQSPIIMKKVQNKLIKQIKQQMMNKAKKQLMQKVIQQAKQEPVGYISK